MADVIGIGSTVYDTLMMLDGFPREDTKMQCAQTAIQGGGPCATALVAAARLGMSAAYMGQVGDDPFGRFMEAEFRKYGVSTGHMKFVPDVISFHAVVLVNRLNRSRTCVWSRGTVPPLSAGDVDEDAVREAKLLHLDGHMLGAAVHAARLARESGVKVCHDAGGIYPGIESLLPYVDLLIPSEEFALGVTRENEAEKAAEKLHAAYRPEIIVITQGERGGLLYDGKTLRRYPAFSVDAIDTNGAGDVFHGAFAAAWLRGFGFDASALYASAASAIKCRRFGARAGIPADAEVRAFLNERGFPFPL